MNVLSKGFGDTRRDSSLEADKGALLVVDDELSVAESIADLFRREYPVLTASGAEDGFTSVVENDVAVVISDQRMPGETGAELLARVAEYDPAITRILLTGYADLGSVVQAVNKGKIYYYLSKPWRGEELHLVVDKAFEHNGLLRERDHLMEQLRAANAGLEGQVAERTRELQSRTDELEASHRIIEELSRKDPLTGLSNRRHWDEIFATEAARSTRQNRPLSLIVADIDRFKSVNDTHGHAAGDLVLKAVATMLKSQNRTYDVVARFGGEEFVVLLPDTPMEEALRVAERLRVTLQDTPIEGFPETITASFGVASLVAGKKPAEMFANADAALYRAKKNGRNRVESEQHGVLDMAKEPYEAS